MSQHEIANDVKHMVHAIKNRNINHVYLMECVSRGCRNVACDNEIVCDKHLDGGICTIAVDVLLASFAHVLKEEGVTVPTFYSSKRELKAARQAQSESGSDSSTSDDDVVVVTTPTRPLVVARAAAAVVTPKTAGGPRLLKDGTPSAPRCNGVNKKTGQRCGNKTHDKSGICHAH